MIRVRKRTVLVVAIALVLAVLVVTPVFAATVPDEEVIETSFGICQNHGQLELEYTNDTFGAGAYFMFCSMETVCSDPVWLNLGETVRVTLPVGDECVILWAALGCDESALECMLQFYELGSVCGWPACSVDTGTCEGGAGLYPPSNNGVPYNGYNDAGNFLLVVDSHCGQSAEWVDVFTGDPLTELTQVMSLWVDPNGWTQFSQADIQNIRDMYDYSGEIWFKVHSIGDRYYGLHELMTHPNLGSGE